MKQDDLLYIFKTIRIPRFKILFATSLGLAIAVQLMGLIPPLIMKEIIDYWIPEKRISSVIKSTFFFIFIPILMASLNTFYKYFIAMMARKLGRSLTLKAFKNVLLQNMNYFDNNNSGELSTFIRQETVRYIMFWLSDLPQIISNFIICLILIFFVFKLHWIYALFFILYFPLAYYPSNYFADKVKNMFLTIFRFNGKMTQLISDSIRNIKFIKSYQLEGKQVSDLHDLIGQSIQVWGKIALYDNLSGLWLTSVASQLLTGILFIVSSIFIIRGEISLGTLIVLLSYLTTFYYNANNIMSNNYEFKKQIAEFLPLAELIRMDNIEIDEGLDFNLLTGFCFRNVKFRYKEDRDFILEDCTINFPKGKWIGIVGKSGIGKSTILDLLLMLYVDYEGEICVNQVSLQKYKLSSLRSKMAYVSQNAIFFPGTIRENLLRVVPQASDNDINRVLKQVGLLEFIESCPQGLDTDVGENGDLLSGGQKQRLNLAYALLRNSEIILLDEPNVGLDKETSNVVKETIKKLRDTNEYTIISVSHDLDFLSDCDLIYQVLEKKAILIENRLT